MRGITRHVFFVLHTPAFYTFSQPLLRAAFARCAVSSRAGDGVPSAVGVVRRPHPRSYPFSTPWLPPPAFKPCFALSHAGRYKGGEEGHAVEAHGGVLARDKPAPLTSTTRPSLRFYPSAALQVKSETLYRPVRLLNSVFLAAHTDLPTRPSFLSLSFLSLFPLQNRTFFNGAPSTS